jgi:uncharacterized protein YjbJ (UPF0337 family)
MAMNKDQVEGKIKDVAGRVERQAGEWTGDKETQAEGSLKQAEGKVQNAWGNVKDATKKAVDRTAEKAHEASDDVIETEEKKDEIRARRRAS